MGVECEAETEADAEAEAGAEASAIPKSAHRNSAIGAE